MSFYPARLKHQSSPRALQKVVAAGAGFEFGALVLANASDEWAECGADPAAIAAVTASAYGADTLGYGGHGKKEFPPGYMQAYPVQDEQPFLARYVGTLPAANGGSYGVVRDSDSLWKVDFTETVATRVKLIGRRTNAPESLALVEVSFLAASVQIV